MPSDMEMKFLATPIGLTFQSIVAALHKIKRDKGCCSIIYSAAAYSCLGDLFTFFSHGNTFVEGDLEFGRGERGLKTL